MNRNRSVYALHRDFAFSGFYDTMSVCLRETVIVLKNRKDRNIFGNREHI